MGTNPMQKMKTNSILTGLLGGLAIGALACGALYVLLTSGTIEGGTQQLAEVYVVTTNIKSGGQVALNSNVEAKNVNIENVPADAVAISEDAVITTKIDLTAGTILTAGMLNLSGEKPGNDLREQEYNMISLPTKLSVGDFIDIRLQLPNGGDYIVVSKKQVINCNNTTVWLNMNEEEIDLMSNAIIEYYIMTGSKLYATTYTDPGLQVAAIGTYVPNEAVVTLINSNPNITSYINSERYQEGLKAIRNNNINTIISLYNLDKDENGMPDSIENVEKRLQEEIKSLKAAREAYFAALNTAN